MNINKWEVWQGDTVWQMSQLYCVIKSETIDKRRLIKLYGSVDDVTVRNEIIEAIKFQIGIRETQILTNTLY